MPTWRADGKELFYITEAGKVMSAEIETDRDFANVVTKQLFQTSIKLMPGRPYDVTSDGSRFLIITPAESDNAAPMMVLLNWIATLDQKQ